MNHKNNKRQFNTLLSFYNKCVRKYNNLRENDVNLRRQHILLHHIERAAFRLKKLYEAIQKVSVATATAGALLIMTSSTVEAQSFGPVEVNPFGLNTITGFYNNSSIKDLDNDGDLDMIVGNGTGTFQYFENIGTATNPSFATVQVNPFGLTDIGSYSSVSLADLDNDGDFDLMSGDLPGQFYYFENIGSVSAPQFDVVQINPFGLTDIGSFSTVSFVDLDNDGDLDLMSGHTDGNFYFFENIGTQSIPSFAPVQTNPFALSDVGLYSTASFADLDYDGDLDLMGGEYVGKFKFFENVGTISSPSFAPVQENPFGLTIPGMYSTASFADLDNDGDQDLMAGNDQGSFQYFENLEPTGVLAYDKQEDIKVYQAETDLIIDLVGANAKSDFTIISVSGQLVYEASFQNSSSVRLNLEKLTPGVYMLSCKTQDGAQIRKKFMLK